MTKSTHRGECQLCGSVQLLPNDLLSIHGYTVKWHMFQGDCRGSREKPYELSCDELKIALITTQESIERIEKAIADLSVRTGNTCYHRIYKDRHYHWVEVEIISDERGRIGYTYDGQRNFKTVMPFLPTEEEIARHCDRQYISLILQTNIAMQRNYKTWCEERVKSWVLKPLTPR